MSTFDTVADIIAETADIERDKITPESHAINDLGIDSLAFLDIARCCRAVLDSHTYDPAPALDGLLAADRWARQEVARWTRP